MWDNTGRQTRGDDTHRLQLLVEGDGDREALRSMLGDRYEVVVSDRLESADCYLVDDVRLPQYRAAIRRLKAEAHPTFRPVVLLQRADASGRQWHAATDDREDPPLVDEIVTAPIDRATLSRRLENLLVRRRQSAELSERYETVQQRFERLFNATNDAIFVVDPTDTRIAECNPAASALVGRSRTALLGTTIDEILSAEGDRTVTAFLTSVVETGEGWTDEFVCRDHDGDRRQVEISATTFEDADGSSVLFSIRDVTERKRYQAELELKTKAIEGAPVGITISDPSRPDNPLIYANEGFEAITGYSAAEIVGRNCRFLQGPDTSQGSVDRMRSAIDNAESVVVELRNYRKDGSQFWNRVTIAPVTDDDGAVVNYIGFQEDITDRKERERDLQLFRKAVETSGNAVIIADRTGEIQYVNPAFEAQSGYSRREIHERDLDLLRPARSDDTNAMWETVLDGETWAAERISQRKSGELYRVEQEVSPIRNGDGEITHVVAIERDVTDRRLREQQLAVLNRILRHNLRNGLNVIEGNATLLADAITDEDARTFVAAIESRAAALADLSRKASAVRTLFDREGPRTSVSSVDAIFSDIEAEAASIHPDATVHPTIDGDLAVRADSRLTLALLELINYTLEYNASAAPEIRLRAVPDSERGEEWVEISVTDDGDGIPDHEWQPIVSGDETPLEHGTGLGLWLVHWTVSLLGGEVTIEPVESGTRVVLTLPRVHRTD
ncbi:MAG: PAS domain S-box protein [Halohasta sp.]